MTSQRARPGRAWARRAGAVGAAALLASACTPDCPPAAGSSASAAALSDLALFAGEPRAQVPAAGVFAFDVNSPRFSDFTRRRRFLKLPEGTRLGYDPSAPWQVPAGSVVAESFSLPADLREPAKGERLIETRVLVAAASGWLPFSFLWREDQSDAACHPSGSRQETSWIDAQGDAQASSYVVPNIDQCRYCHSLSGAGVLGVRTRQLNRANDFGAGPENQIDHLASAGLLAGAPEPAAQRQTLAEPSSLTAPVDARVRAYFDANCAHCHRAGGLASGTGLSLGADEADPFALGICRRVSGRERAGGRDFVIAPGDPDASALLYRLSSTVPEVRMPQGPNEATDPLAVALVDAWIRAMPAQECP